MLVILLPSLSFAQALSSKGRFSIEFDRGCAPFTVNVTILDNFTDVERFYYYEDPNILTSDTTFTFTSVGSFTIVQVNNNSAIADKTDTLTIEVIEPQRPEISVTRCANNEVTFTSIDRFYDSIRLYYSSTDSVTLQPNQSNSYAFSNSGTQTIRLKGLFNNADEVCLEYFEDIDPIANLPAPEIMTASVKQLCRDSYALYLTLSEVLDNVNYRINLEQQGLTTLYDGFLDSTDLIIQDIPFKVADYCITVETLDPCVNTRQSGNPICDSPTSLSLSPFQSLYSTYNGSSIYINLDEVSLGTFEVERRFEGSDFQSRGIKEGSFEDPIGSITRAYYYRINYRDFCGEILFTAETNPPLVDAVEIDDNRYEVLFIQANNALETLNETTYRVGNEGSFATETINANSFNINLSPENGGPTQLLTVQSRYDNNLILNSNTQTLRYEFVVYVPSAFTPNGDGMNDLLEFFGVPSENASVNIYSRWGQTIYSSEDLSKGWDGIVSGKSAPSGTYFYEIFFETTSGNKLRQRGTFVLLEK